MTLSLHKLRKEFQSDISAIHMVHSAAFKTTVEADLVDGLRDHSALALSLVAEQQGPIVGHVVVSPV
jgi:putative acetyltransferase